MIYFVVQNPSNYKLSFYSESF